MARPFKKNPVCIHSYSPYKPVAFGQREGLIEERVCKKCGRPQRRRVK